MKLTRAFSIFAALIVTSILQCKAQVSMQIVADNDFALFAGDGNGVSRLIYQNDVSWPDQLSNLASFSFNLQSGETTFYLLGMGGGGMENISGTVNGVDLTTIPVMQSSDLSSFLSGYFINGSPSTVADGTYNASLKDVQSAFSTLSWMLPTPTTDADDVALQSPTGHGFHFDDSTAVLYRFNPADVNVAPVPEPSTWALLLMTGGGVAVIVTRRRRQSD